eukprot:4275126-Prymnesium_polylepis.1
MLLLAVAHLATRSSSMLISASELESRLGERDLRVLEVVSPAELASVPDRIPTALTVWRPDYELPVDAEQLIDGLVPTATAFEALVRRLGISDDTEVVLVDRKSAARSSSGALGASTTARGCGGSSVSLARAVSVCWTAALPRGYRATIRQHATLRPLRPPAISAPSRVRPACSPCAEMSWRCVTCRAPICGTCAPRARLTARSSCKAPLDRAGSRGQRVCAGPLTRARLWDRSHIELELADPVRAERVDWDVFRRPDGTWLEPADIRQRALEALGGAAPTDGQEHVFYCQSGVRTTQLIFAMVLAGWPLELLRNYDGSWVEWSRRCADDEVLVSA